MGAAIIATITTTEPTTTEQRPLTAWEHRCAAREISLNIADLTMTYNRIGGASDWRDPRLDAIDADIHAAELARADHLIRAKLLTCGQSHG